MFTCDDFCYGANEEFEKRIAGELIKRIKIGEMENEELILNKKRERW